MQQRLWKQDKQRETIELREAFDDQLKCIGEHWAWLAAHRHKFKDLRDRRSATSTRQESGKTLIFGK
jgi:hypothetical protein